MPPRGLYGNRLQHGDGKNAWALEVWDRGFIGPGKSGARRERTLAIGSPMAAGKTKGWVAVTWVLKLA